MRIKLLIIFFLFFSIDFFSQDEKRLALVIGNANYDDGELKNPENDALLIQSTLLELNFEVILAINTESQRDLIEKIQEYGREIDNYDVGFVYYAGHGVQVNGENYLLPTKEKFNCIDDVKYYGVPVSDMMKHFTSASNKANVIILDACRDNPFEKPCNEELSRSFGDKSPKGLAEIAPPAGSIIAFSTSPGDTASDGAGLNSLYCLTLVENMKKENVRLVDVFRNVRTTIRNESGERQIPMEYDQLEGQFYFTVSNYKDEFKNIEKILDEEGDYFEALEIVTYILNNRPNDKEALIKTAKIYDKLEEYDKSIEFWNAALELGEDSEIYSFRGSSYYRLDDNEKALADFNKAIELEPSNELCHYIRGSYYEEEGNYEAALEDYKKAVELDPDNPDYLFRVAYAYHELEQFENALSTYIQHSEKFGDSDFVYNNMALIYQNNLKNYDKALEYYSKAIEVKEDDLSYTNRGELYYDYLDDNEKALADFNKAIKLEPSNAFNHYIRGSSYEREGNNEAALKDYKKAVELNPDNPEYLFRVAYVYNELEQFENALSTYIQYSEKFEEDSALYNNMANIYLYDLKNYDKALEYYSKAIEVKEVALYYGNRGELYYDYLDDNEKALADFNKAIELEPSNAYYHYLRGG
ncbi:MAG: hypothetical protein CMC51_01375, partial [Flavobacteriaceae bacterium]|nr:hypothetical protein [Flavobacteriaceae bacterium]